MAAHWAGVVWLGDECGRDALRLETADPLGDGLRRRIELMRSGRLGKAAFNHASRHRLSTSGRERGILMRVHSVLRESLRFGDISVHRSDRMDNLLKAHS